MTRLEIKPTILTFPIPYFGHMMLCANDHRDVMIMLRLTVKYNDGGLTKREEDKVDEVKNSL